MATDEQADEVFQVAQLLAEHGISHPSETALRSAVSRGYYSVFLAAQRRSGYNGSQDVHSNVIRICARERSFGYAHAGRLKLMRELRVAADYFQVAEPIEGQDPPHDLSNWNENWTYVKLWAPHLRERLKKWKS